MLEKVGIVPAMSLGVKVPLRHSVAGLLAVGALLVTGTGHDPVPPASADADGLSRPHRGANGLGDAYFPLDGNGGYDVVRYDVHDTYAFGTGRLSGWTRITLTPTQDLARFNLDFLLPVTSVRIDGARATWARPVRHELQVRPRGTLREGRTTSVVVRYAGFPARYSYAGESNWLASSDEVVAMNQPHMAPWWFPSNDHPADKARMRISITVPNGRQVIANGRLVRRDRGPRTSTWHWRSRDPMATYLAFFAAGHFSVRQGVHGGLPWLTAVSQDLPRAWRRSSRVALGRTPRLVDWLSAELGPYPFETTGGLVTSLDAGFALENQTRPTYFPLSTSAADNLIVVHELAHQWFGDDVAIRRWRHIWLNEGFATYMERRYTETHGGRSAAAWLRARYDAIGSDQRFWRIRVADPGADEIFSTAVYERGAMTLVALRNRIGESALDTVLRRWVDDHAGGSASTAQFRALAEGVSGQDLDGFFRAWLLARHKPADTVANGLG